MEDLGRWAKLGQVETIRDLLYNDPTIDVNQKDHSGCTPLHWACGKGHGDVVTLLLAHPAIEVNPRNINGSTPFSWACSCSDPAPIRVLLNDLRVNTTAVNKTGRTPFFRSALNGKHETLAWFIASGRDTGDLNDKQISGTYLSRCTSLEIARYLRRDKTALLLERFAADPERTRFEVRVELGDTKEFVTELFAVIIFYCDGHLAIRDPTAKTEVRTRFFDMAKALPMELQMILCNMVYDSCAENIPAREAELAFRALVKNLAV